YSRLLFFTVLALLVSASLETGYAQQREAEAARKYIQENYTKNEYRVPMRDGVHLFTAVYVPKDASQKYPILMLRTPYSIRPYGKDNYAVNLGPNRLFPKEGYIFVYQDVRGCFMSEGTFVNMTPHRDKKTSSSDIDESSDTYDTVEWLVKNVPNHNG